MPRDWPAIIMALTLALISAYVIADVISRIVESGLRGLLPDEHERRFVDRPKLVIRLVLFLLVALALSFPALRVAGYQTQVGRSPDEMARFLFRGGLKIALIAITAYAVIRVGWAATRRLEQAMSVGTGLDIIERTKRARTLAVLIHKTLSVVVTGIAALMILHELDVDITPVLTVSGIAGLAVGFGGQTLVRDIISGFFLILEDQVRVGDVAVVNGQGGLVEALNLRTIVLRDEQGAVHVFPSGEVKTLSNLSKDFSYYVISVAISDQEDPDRVIGMIQESAATLVDDPTFKPHILAPMEVYGVDDFQPGKLVIKGRIKTVPLKQWTVGRELRKRIAATFRERGLISQVQQVNVRIDRLEELLARQPARQAE